MCSRPTKRTLLLGIACLISASLQTTAHAQALSPIQAQERPNGYPIVGQVMLAGSDARAVAFEQQIKPIVLNIIRLNLASGQVFRNPGSFTLNPNYLVVGDRPNRPMRVYFIDEGAGYRNSLGISLVPFNPVRNERRPKLIFPTVSKPAPPGLSHILLAQQLDRTPTDPLRTGDFVDIPNVQRGDMLDFFLISNGANGGRTVLWNDPEENPYKVRHMVAFEVPGHPDFMIIGFEDLIGGGDLDYEDTIFVVDHGYNFENVTLPH
jgi:hypothetical protein